MLAKRRSLVLHSGSGLSDDQFRAAIAGGVCKINTFTSLAVKATRRLVAEVNQDDVSYFAMITQIRESFHDQCAHHLDVLGTTERARPHYAHNT